MIMELNNTIIQNNHALKIQSFLTDKTEFKNFYKNLKIKQNKSPNMKHYYKLNKYWNTI